MEAGMRRLILLTCAVILSFSLSLSLSFSLAHAQDSGPTPAPAAAGVTDNDVNRVAKQLYCPVCPNTPLDVCETQACQDWRAQIREQLGQGWSDQQVIDFFVAQYGERVLAEPQRKGFTSFVWILPVVAVAIGLVVLAQLMRQWRAARPAAGPAPVAPAASDIPPEVLERLERELRKIA
jgi:cytochrome c-type biogenesis protein CcmH